MTLCRNGNHRLAAAYAWLVATRGDNAELKQVDTALVAIDRRKVEAVLGLLPDRSQTDISICPYPNFWTTQYYPRKPLFKVGSGKTDSYYSYTKSGMELVWQTPALLHKMLRMVFEGFENRAIATLGEALASNDWLPVPTWLLHEWLSHNWFDDAFNQAAPWTPCAQSHL